MVRNRTFSFGDFQRVRDRRGDLTQATLPDASFRAGNLVTAPTAIYDPATGLPDGLDRVQCSNDGPKRINDRSCSA